METKQNKSTINRPEGERVIDAPLVCFDLAALTEQLKSENAWQHNDRNSITIFKSGAIRMVLEAMHPNAEMYTMRPENLLILQVLEGRLKLTTNEEDIVVTRQQFIALHEHIPYSLQAEEESVFLLTVVEEEPSQQ